MYVLDTNVVSELHRPRPNQNVVDWIRRQADQTLYLAAVTLGELQTGIERLRKRDAAKAAALDSWVDEVLATFTVIAIDGSIYRAWARLMLDRPESLYEDALIAATATARGFVVVTRDVRDFKSLGAAILDPFAQPR